MCDNSVVLNRTLALLARARTGRRPVAILVAACGLVMYAMTALLTLAARRNQTP